MFPDPDPGASFARAAALPESALLADPGAFYDRIAHLHTFAAAATGYRRCVRDYFQAHPPPLLDDGARVLDAGCGTGLLTLSLLEAFPQRLQLAAVDLSAASLHRAATAVRALAPDRADLVRYHCEDVLRLPFASHAFELVVTCGAFEYVPLDEAFAELARVLVPGGHLVYFPIRPGPASLLLEVLYHFETRTPEAYAAARSGWFEVVEEHRFPAWEPFGWTKHAVVLRRR